MNEQPSAQLEKLLFTSLSEKKDLSRSFITGENSVRECRDTEPRSLAEKFAMKTKGIMERRIAPKEARFCTVNPSESYTEIRTQEEVGTGTEGEVPGAPVRCSEI